MDENYTLEAHFLKLAENLRLLAGNEREQERKSDMQRLAECYLELARRNSVGQFAGESKGCRTNA
jgi:hypothetical protein